MSWKDTGASHRRQSRGRDRLQGIMWYLNQEPASCCGSENSSLGLSLGPPLFMLSYSVTSVPPFSHCSLTVPVFPPQGSPQLLSLLSSLPASLRDWQEVAHFKSQFKGGSGCWLANMGQVSTPGPINSFLHLLFGELDLFLRKMHTYAIFTHNFKGFTELRHNHEP